MEPTEPNSQQPNQPEGVTPSQPTPVVGSAPAENPTPSSVPAATPAPSSDGQPHMVVGGAEQSQTATPMGPIVPGTVTNGGGKKKWVLPAAVTAALVVLLGGGYVFGVYLPNRPSTVYSTSLKNSGKAVDALVDYTETASKQNYKSYGVTGTLKVKSAGASVDGTLTGSFDETGNATVSAKVDALGQNVNVELRSLKVKGNDSPDIYLQLKGIKAALDSFGASSFDNLDGQWIAVDHTLLDTYTKSLSQASASGSGLTSAPPTAAQATDALKKVQEVNKQYLFTSDSGKAVLTNQKYIGKETQDGRSVYHYTVGYSKDHLAAYVGALKTALDSSSLNDWSKAQSGQNLSKQLDLDSLVSSTKQLDGKYTFDLYADVKTKLVHSVKFSDPSSSDTTFTLAQNYTGGDEYPFDLGFSTKTDGQTSKGDIKATLNKKTNNAEISLTATAAGSDINFDFKLTPSDKAVQVSAPSGAQPIMNILGQLGLSGAF